MAEFIKKPQNTYLFGLLALFITMYGPRLSPKLPEPIQELFEKTWFRAAVMFLAVYLAQRDFRVSLLVTVVFLVLMNVVQNTNVFETFLQNYQQNIEGFAAADLTSPQKKCAETIGDVFKGKNIALPGSHSNMPENDNLSSYMDKSSKMTLQDGNMNGINRARTWCQQHGNSTSMQGVPDGDKVATGCNLITSACDKNSWLRDTTGSKVDVPKFYQGTCARIQTDPKNWVIKKPTCFNKTDPQTSGADCSSYSQNQCSSHKDNCFWGDPERGFKNSNYKIPGGDNSVVCVPRKYSNTSCEKNFTFDQNVPKNSKEGEPSYKFTPTSCIQDMKYNSHSGQASYSGDQCKHSGQCCGYQGENGKKGSYCINSEKGNFCMDIDPTNHETYQNTFFLPASTIAKNSSNSRFKQSDVTDLSLRNFKEKTGSYSKMIVDPSAVTTVFGEGADWKNVYYGDDQSKSSNPNSPNYPDNLYVDGESNMGLGCWIPETGIPPGSKFFADVDSGEGKKQAIDADATTGNLKTEFGVVSKDGTTKGETFIGSRYTNEHFVGNAPPVSNCNVYDENETRFVGTGFYPMYDNNQLQGNNRAVPYNRPAYSGEVNWQDSVNA